MKRFKVRASREGDWWFLEVEGVAGGYSQARRLDQVEATVRDLLATLLDVPPDSFEVDVEAEWPLDLRLASSRAAAARRSADEARDRASAEIRNVALAAARAGFTVRDVAALLGISPQRVSQLRPASGPLDLSKRLRRKHGSAPARLGSTSPHVRQRTSSDQSQAGARPEPATASTADGPS
jgi:hypothetical protein